MITRAHVLLMNLKYIWSNKGAVKEVISNILIIEPKSDHCLAMSVSKSVTHSSCRDTLLNLSFVNLEWQSWKILAAIWKEKRVVQFLGFRVVGNLQSLRLLSSKTWNWDDIVPSLLHLLEPFALSFPRKSLPYIVLARGCSKTKDTFWLLLWLLLENWAVT